MDTDSGTTTADGEPADPPTIDEVIRRHTLAVLAKHGGSKAKAAAELGVCVKTCYLWLAKWENEGLIVRTANGWRAREGGS